MQRTGDAQPFLDELTAEVSAAPASRAPPAHAHERRGGRWQLAAAALAAAACGACLAAAAAPRPRGPAGGPVGLASAEGPRAAPALRRAAAGPRAPEERPRGQGRREEELGAGRPLSTQAPARQMYDSVRTTAPPIRDIKRLEQITFHPKSRNGFSGEPELGGGEGDDSAGTAGDVESAAGTREQTAEDRSGLQVSDGGKHDAELPGKGAAARGDPEAPEGTCERYGCDTFDERNLCQCNDDCVDFRTCCPDYADVCAEPEEMTSAPPLARSDAARASCKAYGCGSFEEDRECQCNDNCEKFHSCCDDYSDECGDSPPGRGGGLDHGATTAPEADGAGQDCTEGYETRLFSWTEEKKKWCCQHKNKGCEGAPQGEGGGGGGHGGGGNGGGASCKHFGCTEDYVRGQECQCNAKCQEHDSCCEDYSAACSAAGSHTAGASRPEPGGTASSAGAEGSRGGGASVSGGFSGGSCATYGCVSFAEDHACQCNSGCEQYDSCCADFADVCTAGALGHSSAHAPAGGGPSHGNDGRGDDDYFSSEAAPAQHSSGATAQQHHVTEADYEQTPAAETDYSRPSAGVPAPPPANPPQPTEPPSTTQGAPAPTPVPTPPPTPPPPTPDPDADLALR
ncbi:unnamed protein product [Prorocentrum cordatum]|uniref:SMB domain-containing protein n=1 Tax=Prorocentrum cordatum TaxID=2364126 RepID=A0ABN9SU30_9DINO|nr:unnamed protein product [Polarella glacialis]